MRVLTSAVATLALVASGLVFQAGVNVPGAWAAVSKTSLVLSYDFSSTSTYGGTGTTFTDLSGGGHTGTLVGSAAVTSGAFTSTSATNGTNYATISGGLTGFNAGLTVSFEANLAAIESYERVLSIGDVATNASGLWNNGGDGLWIGRYWNTTELAIEPFNNGVSGGQCRTSGAGVDASFARWTFTITATGLCRVFKNGVEVSTNNNGGANSASGTQLTQLFSGTSQTVNYLGRSHWTADPDLGGSIRWINVYKTALSAAEITDQTTGTVTFDANGGSGTTPSQSSTSATTLASNQFTRSGYTFSGWNSAANGSGTAWGAGATYSFSDDITLYAQWSLNAPTVTTAPSISGTAQTGQTLTATDGSYVSGITPTIASRWQRSSDNTNWTDISGATAGTYTLTDSDVGNYVRYAQTVTNTAGSITSTSAATTMVLSTNSVTGGSGSSSSVGSMFTVPAGSTVYNVTLTSSNLSGNFSFPSAPAGLTLVEGYSTTASYMPTSITGTGSIFSFRGTGDAINTALATLNYNSPSASIDVLKINYAVGSATATDVKNYIPIYDNGQLTYHYYSFTSGLGSLTYSASVSAVAANQFSYGGLTSPNRWYLATTRYAVENAKAVALIPGAQAGAWTSAIGTSGAWTWPANTDGFASAVTFSSGGQSGTNYAQNGLPTYWKDSTQPSVLTGYMGYWQGSNQTQSWATGDSANAYANGIFAETYATAPLSATSSTQTYRSITAPGAPTALAATASGATAASLAWTAPSAGTDPLTDYIVQWSTSSTFASAVTTVTRTASTTASQSITGLTANQTIYLRVAAKSSVTGAWSSTLTYTMPNAEAPSVVGAAAGWVSSTNASVALQWTAPTAYNSATISNYVVERSTDQATWTTVTRTVSTDPSQLVTGLNQATTYYFRVRAVLSSGTGANSSTVTVTTGSAATSLTVVASGGGVAGTDYTVAGGLITPLTSASVSVNAADLQTVLGANGRVWLAADTVTVSSAVSWSANALLQLGNSTVSRVAINADLAASGATAGLNIASAACGYSDAGTYTGCYSLDVKTGANVTLTGATPTLSIGGTNYTVVNTVAGLTTFSGTAANYTKAWALTAPLDLSATNYSGSILSAATFSGTLDGLGNTLNNVKFVSTATNVGLFATVGGGTVRNLGMLNVTGTVSQSSSNYVTVGVIAALTAAGTNTFDQVWSTGSLATTSTTETYFALGGLLGWLQYGSTTLTRSWSSVSIDTSAWSPTGQMVGGLVGGTPVQFNRFGSGGNLTVNEAYSTGSIKHSVAGWRGIGGILGLHWDTGTTLLTDVFSWGAIQVESNSGGIVGAVSGGTLTFLRTYTSTSTCATNGAYTGCVPSQKPGATLSGTTAAAWGSTTGTGLTNLTAAAIPVTVVPYLRTGNTSFTDGSFGAVGYKLVDGVGKDITSQFGTAGYPTISGTPTWDTISASTAAGTYSVKYSGGLSLTGTAASAYTLNPAASGTSIALTYATTPSAPTGVTVTGSGATTTVVGWTAAAQSGATAITNYRVWYSASNSISGATTVLTGSANTWARLSGLTANTTYYVWVQPMGAAWVGDLSAVASGATKSAATTLTVSSSASSNVVTTAGAVALSGTNTTGNISVTDLQTLLAAGNVILAADTVTISNAVSWSVSSTLTLGNTSVSTVAINADLAASGTFAGLIIAPDACAVNTSTGVTASTGCYSIDTKNGANVTLSGASSTANIANNAYTVLRTEADIVAITTNSRSGWWFVLGNPITMATNYSASPVNLTYTGKFDGLGNTVNNLKLAPTAAGDYGLFAMLSGATVRNLGVVNALLSTNANVDLRLGVLAGNGSYSGTNTISGIWTTGFLTTTSTSGCINAGGVLGGASAGTLNASRFWSSVQVVTSVACASTGGLIGSTAGGIASGGGTGATVTVDEAYSTGDVARNNSNTNWRGVAGIIGVSYGTSNKLRNVFSWGNITASDGISVAGIVGPALNTTLENVYTSNAALGSTATGYSATSVIPGNTVTGLTTGLWGPTNGSSLVNLPAPTKSLYAKVIAPTDGSYGTMSYQVVDSTGTTQTLSSLGLNVSGTPVYTITAATVKGSYSVNYSSGLTLGGTNASVYALSAWINTTAVTISKYNQLVTWAPTPSIAFGSGTATPNATPTSAWTGDSATSVTTTFSYAVSSAGTTGCAVNTSTGVLSYTAAGTCVVTVTGAATGDYLADTEQVSFVIGAPTASITVVASGGGTLGTDFWVANGALYGAAGSTISVNAADVATALAAGAVRLAATTVTINSAVSWSANTVLALGLNTSSTVAINADLNASGATAGLVIAPGTYAIDVKSGANVVLSGASATLNIGGSAYTVINTAAGLNAMAASGNIALTTPIALSSAYTTAIRTGTFTGTLDGLGNSINGYRVSGSTAQNLGLFDTVSGATIRNVGMTNISITAATVTSDFVGAISAYSLGATTLTQVWSTGTVKSSPTSLTNLAIGGLVGIAAGGTITIAKSWSNIGIDTTGTSATNLAVGGILGTNAAGMGQLATSGGASFQISEAYSLGNIRIGSGSWQGTGGIVGLSWATVIPTPTITDAFNWGAMPGSWGGVVGTNSGSAFTLTRTYTSTSNCTRNLATVTGCVPSVAVGSTGTYAGGNWTSSGAAVLANVQSPLIPLYVQTTFSNSTGSVSDLWYQILDSSGAVVTLSSLNLSISGTPVYTPSSMPVGSTYSVGYDSGLTLGGAAASRYSLSNWVSPTSVFITRNVTTLSWSPTTAFTRLQTGSTLTAPTTNSSATPTYSIAAAGGTGCAITSARVLTFTAAGTCQVKVDYAQVTSYTAASQTVSIVISNAAPLAPTAVTVAGGTATGQLDVSWTAPSTSTTGGTISSYTMEYSTDNSTWTAVTGLTGTSTTITGLTNDTPYYVRVKALNATDSLVGAWGTPAGAVKPYWKPTNSVAPSVTGSAVGGLTLTAADGTWGANGNTITSTTYQWQISSTGTSGWTNISGATSSTYVPLASQAGKYLAVQVTKTNSAGSTALLSAATSAVQSGLATDTALGSVTRGNQQITVNWVAPSTLNGGTVSAYKVLYRAGTSGAWTTASSNVASSATSYTITGLTNGTAYTVQVIAVTAAGDGTAVDSGSTTVTPATGPSNTGGANLPAITGTVAVGRALSASTGTWVTGGDAITGYSYQWQSSATSGGTYTDISGATASTYTPPAGQSGRFIRVVVTATNAVSSASATSAATNAVQSGLAAAPTALAAAAANQAEAVKLTWTAPTTLNGGVISDYLIEYSAAGQNSWTTFVQGASTATTAIVDGLTPGTVYDFRVSAVTAAGAGASADYLLADAAATAMDFPNATAMPTLSGKTAVAETLAVSTGTWQLWGNTASTSYSWWRSADAVTWTQISGASAASYTPTSSDLGQYLQARVKRTNSVGASEESATSALITSGLAAAPTISSVVRGDQQLSVSWSAPSANGGTISGYKVSYRSGTSGAWTSASASVSASATSYTITGLTNGTGYTVQVLAVTAAGDGAAAATSSVATPATGPSNAGGADLPAITGTSAVGRVLSASTGTWSDGGDAVTYSYQWQSATTAGGSYTNLSGATSATYTVPANQYGRFLKVVVTATNTVSAVSATSAATSAVDTGIADAPTLLTVTPTSGQLAVTWTAPGTNGGVISDYNVYYRASGATAWTPVSRLVSPLASQTILSLTNGTAYDLKVEAVTAAGAGPAATYSANTNSTPYTSPINTSLPTLSGTGAVGTTLSLSNGSWNTFGRTATYSYTWQYQDRSTLTWAVIANATTSILTIPVDYLGTKVRGQVTATINGLSRTATVTSNAITSGLASAPQSVAAVRADQALDLTWVTPATTNGGVISSYTVQYSTDGSTWSTASSSVSASATSYTISSLTNGTPYYVQVLANTAAGASPAGAVSGTVTPSTTASNSVLPATTGTPAVARTLTASTGTWSDGGAAITYSYQWESAATANGSFSAISGATNATYVIDTADVTKFIRVVVTATNVAGTVTATSAATTVVESGLADAPTGLSATFASTPSLRVNVSWTAPSGLNGASAITGYAVSYATSATGSYTVASSSIAANATSYAVTGLTAGTTYYFKVAALTAAGTGSLTSASSAVVFGGAPANTAVPVLTGSLGEGEQLSVTDGSWNQFGLAATMSYQWERSANGTSGWTPIANETYNSYTLGHDDVDQYVRVVVEASNVVGSTDVAVVAGQIGSAIAAAPTVTATDGNAQVALSWTTPATNGGILRGFIVEQNDGSGWTQVGGQLSTATTSLTITGLSNAQSYDFRVRALTTLAGLNGTATGRIPYTVPSNTVLPSISGSVAVNETVSANDGSWNGNGRSITSTTYQWQSSNDNGSSWNAINLATNAQYSVPAGLQGQLLRVVVTRVNPAGSTIAVAVGVLVAAGVPTVDTAAALAGTATVGYALTGTDAVFTAHDSAGVTLSGRWEVSANGSTGWTAIAGATSASYTATSAENGKYLRFVSIATNSLNATESASTASAQIASGVPAAPSSVSTTPRDTAIDVTWSALSGAALNGATRSSYRLEWSTDNATWSGTNVSGTSATIAGLSNNTAYFVRVAAVSSVTVTGVFGAASSTTVPFGAPINTALPALTGAQARGYSLSSSAGSWDSNGRSVTATATRWQRSTDSGQTWADISGATSASYTLTASDVGNLVRSVVTATNAFGPTSIESAASGAIGSAAAAAPSNLTVTPGDGQLSLDWDAPTALSGGTIVDYEVQISTDQNTWTTVSHTASTATDLVVTGLSNATGYWVSVAAVTTVTGAPVLSTSATVPFGLPINTALPSISGSERIGDTLTAGMGSWDGNGRLIFQTDYQWQSSADNGSTWTNIAGATGQSYVPSGVLGQLVRVQVTNRNLAGATLASSAATGVIGIGTPGAPTGLTLAPTDLGIAASWTAPSWLADGTVSDYTVELNDGSGWVAVSRGASAVSSQAITGLTLGQSYQVRVRTETGLSSAWTTSGSFTAVGKPSLQVAPAVSGTPLAGSTLSVSSGIWANNGTPLTATTYQWQSSTDGTNWTDIAGAHAATVTATGLRYVRALVTASNAAGFTQTATAPTLWVVTAAPSAPLALNVVPGDQQLAVSWTVPSALGGGSVSDYVVEYSTDGNSWTSVSRTASATPSHTITGLTNGSDYLVRVRAVTSIPGSWVYSTATERPYGHPIYVGSPAPITGTVRFDQTLYANPGAWDWNGSSSSAISYQWQSSSDGGLSWADISGAAGSSYHVTGFVGSKIRVNITATNAAGQSTTTPSAATGPVAAANPSMPLNFTAVPGDQEIALSWTAPASLGGTALVSYVVQTSLDTTTWTTVTRSNATATTETVTGLSNDTPYYVRVRAMTAVTGAWATASGAVVPYGLPINTVLPAVSGTMEFGQTLLASSGSWNENGRVATLSYQWQVKLAGTWTNIAGATSASYQIADYVGSELRAQVTATNLAGPTTASTAATTAVVARPATPVRALSVTLADQALELSWLSPADLGGSTVSDYRVQVKAAGGTWTTVPRTPSTATSQTISGLSNGTDYEVRVQAITTVDGQLASASGLIPRGLPISTSLPAVSGTVQYGSAVATTVGSWNANGASISAQAIQWQVQLGGSWTNIPGATGASLSITDYVGSVLRARVTSTNAAGSTVAYSAATQAVLADPASAPTNLTLTPGDQSLTAAWSAPSYVGGDFVVNYLVEISSGGAWTAVARTASTATSQTVSGLINGTSYSVRVSALTSVTGQASGSASTTPRSLPISTGAPSVSWASPLGTTVSAPQVGRTLTATAGSWNPNGTAITGYGYQWQINTGSGWTSIPGATASSYQPTGNVGATLRVQVTASNVAGGTAAVSTASVPIVPAPASVPRTVTVTEADQALQVSWQAPTSTGGSAIANYAVDWSVDNGSTWTSVSRLVSTATTQSITSLSNATEYLVRVRALNGVDGEWAVADPATPRGVPIAIGVPGVAGTAQFGATLTAGPGPWNTNGADIDSFTFQWQSSRDGVSWANVPGASGSSYVVGLYVGSRLRVQVTATNEAGSTITASLPTAVVNAIAAATPQLTSQSVGNAQMTLGWTPPIHSGGVDLTGYTLEYSTDQSSWTSVSTPATTTSVTITGLRNGSSYFARVRAETGRSGDWSPVAGPFTPVAPPAPPAAPVVVAPNYDYLRINIMPVAVAGTVLAPLTGSGSITVQPDGRIELAPTQSVALRDGQPIAATVNVTDTGLAVQTETVAVALSFSTGTSSASAEGATTVLAGASAELSGSGFAEGSPVVGWIQSDPVKIGEAVAAGGQVTGEFVIPASIEPGEHTIQINGVDAAGSVVSIIYGVQVEAAPQVLETVGAGALADPGALASAWIWWIVAALIVLALLAIAYFARRRRS